MAAVETRFGPEGLRALDRTGTVAGAAIAPTERGALAEIGRTAQVVREGERLATIQAQRLAATQRAGVTAFASLAKGSFGSLRATGETLVKATPLILTGLAACVAFRARIWNIGAEGQVFAGAMFAFWVQHNLVGFPALVQIPVAVLGGIVGGALYAGVAAVLKTRFAVDEVISTVMPNYIIVYILSLLLLGGPWSEAGGFFEQTARVDAGAVLPILLEGTRLHLGFLLAIAAAGLAYLVLTRTPLGYEIKAGCL